MELPGHLLHEMADELRFNLEPCLTEGRGRDGSWCGERNVECQTFVPEGLEEEAVSLAAGVGDQVDEKADQQLGREGSLAGEVLFPTEEFLGFGAGQEAAEWIKIIPDCAGNGMGIAILVLCQSSYSPEFPGMFLMCADLVNFHGHIVSFGSAHERQTPAPELRFGHIIWAATRLTDSPC
jgi:hypothetical protein